MSDKPELSLEQIPANRALVEELYGHNLINQETREYALDLLYPRSKWGLWASYFLSIIGSALILVGIIYFFAFNWSKVPIMAKFALVESTILICLACAFWRGIDRLSGKLFLLSASVLVGVFLAVFGQIYQTGADAYQLFMGWAALIFGWVLLSQFAALWIIWLTIMNLFICLYWDQAVFPSHQSEAFIFSILGVFNASFLVLREFLLYKKPSSMNWDWLGAVWVQGILFLAALIPLAIPMHQAIWESSYEGTLAAICGAVLGTIFHVLAFWVYRFKIPNMGALSTIILSLCLLGEAFFGRFVFKSIDGDGLSFFIMGVITIAMFTFAIVQLRRIHAQMEAENVPS